MKKILPFLLVALIFSACTKDLEQITQNEETKEVLQSSRLKTTGNDSFYSGFYNLEVVYPKVSSFLLSTPPA